MRVCALRVLSIAAICLAVATPVQAGYISAVAADAPFMWFRMQEDPVADGTAALDHGTLMAGTQGGTYRGGVVNLPGSISLEVSPAKEYGTNGGKLEVSPHAGAPTAAANYTIEFLVNPTTWDPDFQTVFATQGWGPKDLDLNIINNEFGTGLLQLATSDGGWPWPRVDIRTAAPLNDWSHVAVTYEGVEGVGGTTKYYVNGILLNPGGTATVYHPVDFSQLANIGANPDHGRFFKGGLDEGAVYDYTLTESQILAHYNAIPEPGTAMLAFMGLIGLFALARRNRK